LIRKSLKYHLGGQKMNVRWKVLLGVWVCVMLVTGLLSSLRPDRAAISATVAPDSPTQGESMDGTRRPIVVRLAPWTSTFRIPPPASYMQRSPLKTQTASIIIHYLPNGTTDVFDLSCLTWPAEAIAAFEYAADIWETLITSTVPIEINACWTNFGDPNILGISAADNYYRDFSGALQSGTWYPTALANALHGSRIAGSTVDMHVAYGSTFPWYYGTDGNTPADKVDFATVVLHEICHGLGFAGSMSWDDGVYAPAEGNYQECNGVAGYGCWGGGSAYPMSYDRFTEDGSGNDLINTASYPNPSIALGNALTSNSVWFNGSYANTANGGGRVRLYAPSTWKPGSSYSHLDEIFNETADDLMTYAIPNGHSVHAPGSIIMGILRDIGWPFPMENTAPVLSGLPDLTLVSGEARNNAIDLWAYTTDDFDAASVMTYTITNSPPPTVGVTIDINRYIDITPTASFTGTFPVVVEVTDTGGLTDTDTFMVSFLGNVPPTISGLPDQTIIAGQSKNNAIDLWAYASDGQDLDAALTFTFTASPPVDAGVTIDSNRYIDINPAPGYVATVPVTVQVMDTGGLTDTDTFTINFIETQFIFLPLVLRCYPLVPSLLPISNPDGDGLYTVQWTMPSCCSTPPSQYEFQVATDPAFSLVDGDTTTATSVNVYTPDPATYYWRVRAYVSGQWTGWSNVQSVIVGSFSYVYVQNDTGGTLTIEIVGIEKRSFSAGFFDYWRSVPSGYHTVNVWAGCGSLLGRNINFLEGDFLLHYYCGNQSLVTLPDTAARVMSGVDFIFESTVP